MTAITTRGQAARIQQQLAPHREKLIAKLLTLAEAGDPKTLQLALAYLGPPEERVHVPGLGGTNTGGVAD